MQLPHDQSTRENVSLRVVFNPFRTAGPFWGQTTQILSYLSPKRDFGPERVEDKINSYRYSSYLLFWQQNIGKSWDKKNKTLSSAFHRQTHHSCQKLAITSFKHGNYFGKKTPSGFIQTPYSRQAARATPSVGE